ncbi:MAG: carboxy terminal-processing peptidase [Brevinematia bacterium]
MRFLKKRKIFLSLVFLFLLGCLFSSSKTENTMEGALLKNVFAYLKNHYAYSSLKGKYTERFIDLYIENVDGTKRFLLKKDVEDIKKASKNVDSKLRNGDIELFQRITNILIQRIEETTNIVNEILSQPFDFEIDEEIELDANKRNFVSDLKEKKELWRKLLKNEALNKIILKLKKEGRKKYTELDEKEAREDVKKETLRMLERRLTDKNLFYKFVNSIASSFDAHTEYFPPSEKEDFDINMTGTFEGIGAQLREEGEYIKVQEIIPGGPAAKQKLLKPGDLILKVAQSNEAPIDVVNMPVTEVVRIIRGKKGTEVRLTVKKPDGQIVVIPIIRGKVVLEESYAKVSILDDGEERFGYIYLPSFYRDFRNNESRNSTQDFYLALDMLNSSKVNGILIDLRNNGGGSLEDAIRISGLFFKEGPVVQVRMAPINSISFTKSLNDPDPGVYYEGPVVVLVNEMSASASEIFSAALQDYKRAIIVGSQKTFGKGTVQTMPELGYFTPEDGSTNINLGTLKITLQKFYRINGDSTQKKGVVPDIILPSIYGYINFGEENLRYPLEFDTIKPAKYEIWTNITYDLESLKKKSEKRVSSDPNFNFIEEAVRLIKEKNNQPAPLRFEKAVEFYKTIQETSEKLLTKQTNSSRIKAEWVDYRNVGEDEDSKIKHDEWLNQISKDIYIKEAMNILKDVNNH